MKDPMGLILAAARTSPVLMEAARAVEARIADLEGRTCQTCKHGHVNPKYPIEEIGVTCTGPLRAYTFMMPFHCARYIALNPQEPTP